MILTQIGLLVLAAMPRLLDAYSIDKSCGVNQDWIRQNLVCAFGMAQLTMNFVGGGGNQQYQKAVAQLITDLFGTQTTLTNEEFITGRFKGTWPPNSPAAFSRYTGVLSMSNEAQIAGGNDVAIYCDFSRFEYKAVKNRWYNKDLDEYVSKEGNAAFPNPNDSCSPTDAIAWTYASGDTTKRSEIQLCGWFLEWAAKNQLPTCASFGAKLEAMVFKAFQDKIFNKYGYTEIDFFSPLDKVLLHELTHTRPGGETVDVKVDPNGGTGLSNLGYGWKNCRTISSRTDTSGPAYNADSFALLGSATRILNTGMTINADGTLNDPPAKRRRALLARPVKW